MGPEEREKLAKDGYVRGLDVPAPAVISFNGQVSSASVSEFLAYITGYAGESAPAPRRVFDLISGTVRRATVSPRKECLCAEDGVKGMGDAEKLPVRRW